MEGWINVANLAFTVLVAVVLVARQFGFLEGRTTKRTPARAIEARPSEGINGHPSLGELARRLDAYERANDRDHTELRSFMTAIQRRIDGIMGQG